MIDLKDYTAKQLKAEIGRREMAVSIRPTPVDKKEMGSLLRACVAHIDELAAHGNDEKSEHYIYEAAMEMVYGPDVWKWINGVTA